MGIDDSRFYMLSSLAFTISAITAGAIMRAAGISEVQTLSIVVTIMGFATLAITQYRASAKASSIGEKAADAAINAAKAVNEVKQSLESKSDSTENTLIAITEGLTARIVEINEISKSTHKLVNSQRTALLKAHAALWQRLADYTGSSEDQKNANIAIKAVKDHEVK